MLICILFGVVGIVVPICSLLGMITYKVALLTMNICLGCSLLFIGFILRVNTIRYKVIKLIPISIGVLIIMCTIFILFPAFYFK